MVSATSVSDIVLGKGSEKTLKDAHVLLVGCGGIGCEVLKNLAMAGIGNIDVIDLDTIDVSNLNRQFLFQKQHVGQLKSLVASQQVHNFNPNVKITPYNGNIMDPSFNASWYQQFDLVINALDNVAARKYVNGMCLLSGVPLVESGTEGFQGQTTIHIAGLTKCYECEPKKSNTKTYPVCTIRSTPSAPIHCIVWARNYLLQQLFGSPQDIEDESSGQSIKQDDVTDEDRKRLKSESASFSDLVNSADRYDSQKWIPKVFFKVYKTDIEALLTMDDLWANGKKKPKSISLNENEINNIILGKTTVADIISQYGSELDFEQKVWKDVKTNFAVLYESMNSLNLRVKNARVDGNDIQFGINFDKDDVDTMNFVSAAANLRSLNYGIELKSKFDIKQMAGNIIPAVATTNAIVAGFILAHTGLILTHKIPLVKELKNETSLKPVCKDIFVGVTFNFESSWNGPNPKCQTCQHVNYVLCQIEKRSLFKELTLEDLLDSLKLSSSVNDPDFRIHKGNTKKHTGLEGLSLCGCGEISLLRGDNLIYDEDLDDNLSETLESLQFDSGSKFTVIFDPLNVYGLTLENEDKLKLQEHAQQHLGIPHDIVQSLSDEKLLKLKPKAAVYSIEIDSLDYDIPLSIDPESKPIKRAKLTSSENLYSSTGSRFQYSVPYGLLNKSLLFSDDAKDDGIIGITDNISLFLPKVQLATIEEPEVKPKIQVNDETVLEDDLLIIE